jgi:hypothetical protein
MAKNTNRAVTLDGANEIFSAIGVQIYHHELGYYYCEFDGKTFQKPLLKLLCKEVLVYIVKDFRG